MRYVLPITFLMLTVSMRLFSQCTDAETKKLAELDGTWGEALKRGDRAFLQNVYADDFRDISPGGVLDKDRSIDESISLVHKAAKVRWDQYIIACTSNTATITHRSTWTANMDGKEQNTYTRSVHILEKRGGRWQVVSNANHPLDDTAILLYMEREWNDAIKNREPAWIERNYAYDATEVNSRSGTIRSKVEAIEFAKNDKSVFESLELSDTSPRVEGNMAVVTGINHLKGQDEQGRPLDRRVRFTDTFIKRDGRWQVWASQASLMER